MLNVNKLLKTSKAQSKKKQNKNRIFFSLLLFLRSKSGYFTNEIIEFSSPWLLHRLLEMKCVQKKENSSRDLLMHHLSSHFLKVVFSALKLFAVLADFPIVRLISFAWAFILNQKYSRLRCLLRVKGLAICFYLVWSGSIL